MIFHFGIVLLAVFITYQLSRGGNNFENYYEIDHYDKKMILSHLEETGVVVVRGYAKSFDTPRKFINFLGTFGRTVTRHPSETGEFHSDLSFLCNSPWLTGIKGDDESVMYFRDMRKFYIKMPEIIRDGVDDMQTNHSNTRGNWCLHDVVKNVTGGVKTVFANGLYSKHPETKTKQIFFNMLMWQLQNGTIYESFNVTFGKDDILLWDNRFIQQTGKVEVERYIILDKFVD